jgi:glutamyl-tRNA synthetase
VIFEDMVRGHVKVKNAELDDLIIRRTDGSPTYNLTVVVDDDDMGITHVIRGDDHINNTPRQINLLKAMGRELPVYAHVPMILGDDGARLSKRHGAVSVMQYRDDGFLPEALLNYLVRLGWSYEDREVFSVDEMVEFFDVADVNKAASSFNTEKLLWLNQQYIKASTPEHIARLVSVHLGHMDIDPTLGPDLVEVVKAQQERAKSLIELADICAFYYVDFDEYNQKSARKAFKPAAIEPLQTIRGKLETMEDWNREAIHDAIHAVVDELEIGFGKIGMPLRLAVTGGAPSPDLDLTLWLVGKEACLRRIDRAIETIQAMNKDAE